MRYAWRAVHLKLENNRRSNIRQTQSSTVIFQNETEISSFEGSSNHQKELSTGKTWQKHRYFDISGLHAFPAELSYQGQYGSTRKQRECTFSSSHPKHCQGSIERIQRMSSSR